MSDQSCTRYLDEASQTYHDLFSDPSFGKGGGQEGKHLPRLVPLILPPVCIVSCLSPFFY